MLLLNKASVQFCASEEKSRYSIVEESSVEMERAGEQAVEREKRAGGEFWWRSNVGQLVQLVQVGPVGTVGTGD